MKTRLKIVVAIVLLAVLIGCKQVAKQDSSMRIGEQGVVLEDLDTPWAIDFLPDGRMIFTERPGRISVFDGATKKIVAEINVTEVSESGLLGIAIDQEFEKNNHVYLYYTHEKEMMVNRVSRFTLKDDQLRDEVILIDDIPSAQFHDGGRIKFGPDGKLYITTGDATNPSSAQNLQSLAGKILRMNKDGSVPQDNPFGNYVFSYGHRNPQGLAWQQKTKQLFSSEHGQSKNDEINIIERGQNYGWPNDCTSPTDEAVQPVRCYTEFTLAPSGIDFLGNVLYVAGLRGTQVRKIVFNGELNAILKEEELLDDLGRIRDVVVHQGYLYVATNNRDGRGIPRSGDDKIIQVKVL